MIRLCAYRGVVNQARTLSLVAHVVAEVGAIEGLLVDEGLVHLFCLFVFVCVCVVCG